MRLLSSIALLASVSSSTWTQVSRSNPASLIEVIVGVKPSARGAAELESAFLAISDPRSSRWGQHLSAAAAEALLAPDAAATGLVVDWLASCAERGSISVTHGGAWVRALASISCMEALAGGPYFTHAKGQLVADRLARGRRAALPPHIAAVVSVFEPSSSFPSQLQPTPRAEGNLRLGTTPSTIRTAYGVGDAQASNKGAAAANKQHVAGFLGQFADPVGDLQSFFAKYYAPGTGRQFSVVGPNDASSPGDEASLDTQYIMAMGANVTTEFWRVAVAAAAERGPRRARGGGRSPWALCRLSSTPLSCALA